MDPFPDMSEEEVVALLQSYEKSGMALGPVPEDLREMLKNVKRGKGQPVEETPTEEITPQPGFVIKTTDQTGRKVFINVCTSDRIPAPGGWGGGLLPEAVEAALAKADDPGSTEALRFPMSVGSLRADEDKRGDACSAVDVVISTEVAAAAAAHRPLKAFLIDLILGHAGQKHGLELDPKFKLPRMAYKGAAGPEPQRVRAERKQLVTEVGGGGGGVRAKAADAASGAAVSMAGAKQQQHQQQQQQQGRQQQRRRDQGPRALAHKLEFEGQPARAAVVTVQLGSGGCGGKGRFVPAEIKVEVDGQEVFVSAAGCQELSVQLPFAVTADGAAARLGTVGGLLEAGQEQQESQQVLQLRLPYLPLRQWVDDIKAAAPRAFGALPVAADAYLELS